MAIFGDGFDVGEGGGGEEGRREVLREEVSEKGRERKGD